MTTFPDLLSPRKYSTAAKYIGTNRITTEIKLHSVSRVSASDKYVLTTEGFWKARVKSNYLTRKKIKRKQTHTHIQTHTYKHTQ